jgi:hypothetical protein
MPKLVCIESPWAGLGGGEKAASYLRDCIRDSISRGEFPIASHAIWCVAGGISDSVEANRFRGMSAGMKFIEVCDLVAVYTDHGISQGMRRAIDYAGVCGKPIVARRVGV